MSLNVEVVIWRGSIAESRHRVEVAACTPDGSLCLATSDPRRVTTFRSSAKPFQLLPLVERGHAREWGWSDEQLAVMAASHNGSAYHAALVRGILERIGCTEQQLRCGYHEPQDPASREHLCSHPEDRSPIWNNCSGKHAGMLCLARSEGWPLADYTALDHPVQQLMHRTVAELAGLAPGNVPVAVDGCSAAVFALPLTAMARAYARLAVARDDGDTRERSLATIRRAMGSFPLAVGGEKRVGTTVMQVTGGRMVMKGGAEGLQCVALPEQGLGLVVKCEDGAQRGATASALAMLEQLGALRPAEIAALEPFRRPIIENHAGLRVGHVETVVRSTVPAE